MSVAREGIFGPVVSVLSFDNTEDALTIANDTPYGLAATVWSKDIDVALRTARSVRAATVAVNGYSEGDIGTPFGGAIMARVEENTAADTIELTADQLRRLDNLTPAAGNRHDEANMASIDA